MTNQSVLLEEKGIATNKNPTTFWMAWLGMLLLSRLPQIIALELLGVDFGEQILWLWLGMGIILIGSTFVWLALRPFRFDGLAQNIGGREHGNLLVEMGW